MTSVDTVDSKLTSARLAWSNATWAYELEKRKYLRVVHFGDKHWRPGKGNLYFQVKLMASDSLGCLPVWLADTYSLPEDNLGERMHLLKLTAPVHHNKLKAMLRAIGCRPVYLATVSKAEYERLLPVIKTDT